MDKKIMAKWGWGGFIFGLVLFYISPKVGHFFIVTWVIGCVSYSVSIGSKASNGRKIWNAIVSSFVLGFLGMIFAGAPTHDFDGEILDEGVAYTVSEMQEIGVRVFIKALLGSIAGIFLADFFHRKSK